MSVPNAPAQTAASVVSKPNAPAPSATCSPVPKTDVKEKMAVVFITAQASVHYNAENGQQKYENGVTKLFEALAKKVNQVVGYRVEGAAQMTCTQLKDGGDHVWLFCMIQTMVHS